MFLLVSSYSEKQIQIVSSLLKSSLHCCPWEEGDTASAVVIA